MRRIYSIFIVFLYLSVGSSPAQSTSQKLVLNYTGSSTIGNFIEDASKVYRKVNFKIDTEPESTGGELAILEGRTDFAGIARPPDMATLGKGVVSSLIGWDAIAIIVSENNPVQNLTQGQLKAIFTGKVRNWKELGGPDLQINPYIVDTESATRKVCRSIILGREDYVNCEVVRPDAEIIKKVANDPGGIGHISFSFLKSAEKVKSIAVNGQVLSLTNSNYPITRPLYLLWWPGRRDVAIFVNWVLSSEGQRIVMDRFIGTKEGAIQMTDQKGSLIVYTETYPVEDGGIFYYPHQSYEIYTPERKLVRNVTNHLSNNDETPSRIDLNPGNYLIRTKSNGKEVQEFFVTIESRKVTKVNPVDDPIARPGSKNDDGLTTIKVILPEEQTKSEKAFNPYGDFRVRAEEDHRSSNDRFRGRFRVRVGMNAQITNNAKFDLRLVSTNNPDDPHTSHVNLNDGFNQIRIAIDRASFYFRPRKFSSFQWWLGKFSNPFLSSNIFSEIVWDADIQPEGTAFSLAGKPWSTNGKFCVTNGTYLLSQFQTGTRKHWLNSSQIWGDWQNGDHWKWTLASSLYYFANIKGTEITNPVLDANEGNSTYPEMQVDGSDTTYTQHYRTNFYLSDNFVLVTYNKLPMPLLFKFQMVHNFGAPNKNQGYIGGISYGRLKEKKEWMAYYQYHYLQQDAIFTPFSQDDALRRTNVVGHVFGLAYAFHKRISLHAWGLLDSSLDGPVGEGQSRYRLDLNVKF